MKNFNCNKCGSTDVYIKESGTQKGLYCGDCGKWIQWLGKEDLRLAERFIESRKRENKTSTKTTTLNEEFRKDIWDRLEMCEMTCRNLKGIVQNEMPISKEEFDDWNKVKRNLVDDMGEISMELYAKIKG